MTINENPTDEMLRAGFLETFGLELRIVQGTGGEPSLSVRGSALGLNDHHQAWVDGFLAGLSAMARKYL